MNILFVNYGDFRSSSLNHIAGFANTLSAQDNACIVAVPEKKATISAIPLPLFSPALYEELIAAPSAFPDGRSADFIHAWTPRENIRKFVLAYQRLAPFPARIIIHLEDNEQFLVERFTGMGYAELCNADPALVRGLLSDSLPHPLRHEAFLRVADGITYIVNALRKFVPAGVPTHFLPPGVDLKQYYPQLPDENLRREMGLRPEEKVIVFTGSSTFANQSELRELYLALAILNERGVPTRLIRTGFHTAGFLDDLGSDLAKFVLELGFIDKNRLPKLLALADVLVQPGQPGAFNDYRLPSKIPEFLAMGKPVILPPTNLAHFMVDGREALFLTTGSPVEIADLCLRVFRDPALGGRLGEQAVKFARKHFDLATNTGALSDFYATVKSHPARADWSLVRAGFGSEIGLFAARLESGLAASVAELAGQPAEYPEDFRLLMLLIRELESSLETFRNSDVVKTIEADRTHWKIHYDLATQHANHLEKTLTLTHTHASNVEKNLQAAHADFSRADTLRQEGERRLAVARTKLLSLDSALLQAQAEIARLDDENEQIRLHQHRLVFQRDEKIRMMQASFSWKTTAWLRALRRAVLDPRKEREVPRPLPPISARPRSRYNPLFGTVSAHVKDAPVFRFSIDYPTTWSFRSGKVLLRGWCFASDATKIRDLRAKIDSRVYPGVYGLKRLDVLAALRQFPQAEYCGFKLEVDLVLGDADVTLEVETEDGVFHKFFEHELSVTEMGGREELTSYEKWIETFDQLSAAQIKVLAANSELFTYKPLISVLVPVYNTPEEWLVKAVDSVRAQAYKNWEICLADDASPSAYIRPLLKKLAGTDSRIKIAFREINGHISAASNSALELAKGEFIALLDHDDELRPHALYEVVAALNADSNCDLIYSDEDKIDKEGRRHEPYFKPDFLPDLYLGQNYTSHLSIYRTEVVRAVGGFRVGFEGSQDWDLGLRVIGKIGSQRVRHIPKILYHWRAIPGSTAFLLSEKNYPLEAAGRALRDHFIRHEKSVEIIPVPGDHWRIKYSLPAKPPRVSLIIPTRNRAPLLRRCVDSILTRTQYPNFDILVVDNHSDEPDALEYFVELNARKDVRVVEYPHSFNYSAINNFGVSHSLGDIVGLLNNDLEVINADWLDEMVSQALRPEIGCVGAMLYYPNDYIQHAGVILGIGGVAGHAFRDFPRGTDGKFNRARLVQNYSAVTAACLVIRKEIYERVGGFDGNALRVAFNDIDFCLKVRAAGYWNLWTPFAELYHHESASRGAEDTPEKHERFRSEVETMLARWAEELSHDPAYNPNLTLEHNDFSLAAPPRVSSILA